MAHGAILKFIILFISCFLCISTTSQPNIIVIVADDMGWHDIGYHNPELYSPTITKLAEKGIILDRFYAQEECTPTRAAFLTGLYPIHIGMQDGIIYTSQPRGLPLHIDLLPQKLKKVGYTTHGVGKWHLGFYQEAYVPTARGFDEFFGIYDSGSDHFQHMQSFFSAASNKTLIGNTLTNNSNHPYLDSLKYNSDFLNANFWADDNIKELHSIELYTRKAQEIILKSAKNQTDPFFMYLAYQAPHTPIQSLHQFKNSPYNCSTFHDATNDDDVIDWEVRRIYCGMLGQLDIALGQIETALVASELWDNTLILFFSDNGGWVAKGGNNFPLKGQKGQYWEGGIRTPAFITGGYIENALSEAGQSGYTNNGLTHVTDLHSTILAVAGSNENKELDGLNMWQSWVSNNASPRNVLLHNINSPLFLDSGALRYKNFKLIVNPISSVNKIYVKVISQIYIFNQELTLEDIQEISNEEIDKSVYLFDIESNPYEEINGDCLYARFCKDLSNNTNFQETFEFMKGLYKQFRNNSVRSSIIFRDDGLYADPKHFGYFYQPWRDSTNIPFVLKTDAILNDPELKQFHEKMTKKSVLFNIYEKTSNTITNQNPADNIFQPINDNVNNNYPTNSPIVEFSSDFSTNLPSLFLTVIALISIGTIASVIYVRQRRYYVQLN